MTASSPPTRRVVDVIELLVERRRESTRLSDIVHTLHLNQATAHAILAELVETGWATRNPADKTFSLGAGLITLAERIGRSPSVGQAARATAEALAADTGYAASVSERVADSLVITAFFAATEGRWHPSVGDRLPFAAPFGPAYAAWDSADDRRTWVARSGVSDPAFRARLEEHLGETRRQGFSVERMSPEMASAIPAMTKLHGDALSPGTRDHLNAVILELTGFASDSEEPVHRRQQYVGAITAPVFDHSARVTHNLCVHPFAALSSRQIARLGRRLRRTADTLSDQRE